MLMKPSRGIRLLESVTYKSRQHNEEFIYEEDVED